MNCIPVLATRSAWGLYALGPTVGTTLLRAELNALPVRNDLELKRRANKVSCLRTHLFPKVPRKRDHLEAFPKNVNFEEHAAGDSVTGEIFCATDTWFHVHVCYNLWSY